MFFLSLQILCSSNESSPMGPPSAKRLKPLLEQASFDHAGTSSYMNPPTPSIQSPYSVDSGIGTPYSAQMPSVGTPYTPQSVDSGIHSISTPYLNVGTPYSSGVPSVGGTADHGRNLAALKRQKTFLYGKTMKLLTDKVGRITTTRLGTNSEITFYMHHFTL